MARPRIPLQNYTQVHGHQMHFSTSNGGPRKGVFRRYVTPPSATARCTCGETASLPIREIRGKVTHWQDRVALQHYIDVLAAAQVHGVDAVKWPPPEHTVPRSGVLSRSSVPNGHNYEADDDFGWPQTAQPVPHPHIPPGTIG